MKTISNPFDKLRIDTEQSRSINFQFSIFKIFITLVVIILNGRFFISIFNVQAQTKTATPSQSVATPAKSEEDQDIESLKEKIATKVAELRQKNNKAISGEVIEKSDTKLKITTANEEEYQVIIDSDLTKFYQVNGKIQKEVKSAEVKKGSYIITTGVINDKSIDANFIYLDIPYIVDSGKVTEVNKEDFYIRLISNNKENYILDVERTTKQEIINIKTLAFEKVGFSKIKEGDTIHFVVKKVSNPKEVNRYSAERVLIIPQEYFIK